MEILLIFFFFAILLAFLIFLLLVFVNEKERRGIEHEKMALVKRIEELEVSFNQRLMFELERYKKEDRKRIEEEVRKSLEKEYKALLEDWKKEEEKNIIERTLKDYSLYITKKIGEKIAPFYVFYQYGINPSDIRFIGCPIDYIAFKGLENENYSNLEIYFISVDIGNNNKTVDKKVNAIKKAVEEKRIKWLNVKIEGFLDKIIDMKEFEKEETEKLVKQD